MPIQQMFLGLGAAPSIEYTASNATNIALSSVFGSDWADDVAKVYIIPSGVTIGGTGTNALTVSTSMGGTLEIKVSGTIIGKGGTPGGTGGDGGITGNVGPANWRGDNGTAGGAASHAINIQSANVTVSNLSGGQISGGGGAGGGGGGGGSGGTGGMPNYAGGDGGNGGVGAGYNQSATSGSAGEDTGTNISGDGGNGGAGGALGNAGSNGSGGDNGYHGSKGQGGSGGAAGKAIYSSNSQSWTNAGSGTYHGSYT